MRSTGMPVQRDTTPAMLSAVTASSDATTLLVPLFSLTRFQLGLELRQLAVLQLAGRLIIAAADRVGEIVLGLVELVLQIRRRS